MPTTSATVICAVAGSAAVRSGPMSGGGADAGGRRGGFAPSHPHPGRVPAHGARSRVRRGHGGRRGLHGAVSKRTPRARPVTGAPVWLEQPPAVAIHEWLAAEQGVAA